MMRTLVHALIAAAAVVAFVLPSTRTRAADDAPVRTEEGLLQGIPGEDPAVRAYLGVPFAQPPIGPLRWRAPQPAARWDGVRQAARFAAVCTQPARSGVSALLPTAPRLTPPSEDCLYLNVWTAATSGDARLPVMVYLPGGGFTTGGGSGLVFDGEALARKGVVVVTANYRLGVLGFLAHPELTAESGHGASGNYGLMDQFEALRWVQRNIAAFGGDPARVTIFGQSAGSVSVLYQMVSPLGAGLFHRAIGQSGGLRPGPMMSRARAEEAGLAVARAVHASSLADLRAIPAADLLKASSGTGPILDGWVIREEPEETLRARRHNAVPLLIGSNSEESNVLLRSPVPAATYEADARAQYGAEADTFLSLYPGGSEAQAKQSQARAFDDRYAWGMWAWAHHHATAPGGRAYLYYFTRRPPADAPIPGAAHDAELYYVFHNLRLFRQQWAEWDRRLEDALSSYWVNFAKTGDPNAAGLPVWPAYTTALRDRVLVVGDGVVVGASPLDARKLAFWERAHAAAMQPAAAGRPATAAGQPGGAVSNPDWVRPFPPFRMIGNVYWVGGYDLSTYLITTSQGHILINTGVGDTARQIKASVEQLGFKMSDVKVLSATHGHLDHVAGLAELKRMTGARLIVAERERELIESGGATDFRFGQVPGMRFDPVKVDRVLQDKGTIELGGVTLTAHLHAGHTKGATSFTFDVRENGRTYRVIIANMGSINPGVTVTGMPGYADIGRDYANTFIAQKELKIDVWLASHAGQFRMHQKYRPGDPYDPNRFVDPAGFLADVRRLEALYLDQVAKERAGARR